MLLPNPAQVLRASQTAGPNGKNAQNRLVDLFGKLLKKLATQTCRHYFLENQDREEVVAETYQQILNPDITRFSLRRGKPGQYFKGLVQNAARKIMTQRDKRNRRGDADADAPDQDTAMPVWRRREGGEELRPSRGRYRSTSPAPSPAEEAEQRDTVEYILRQAPPHLRRALELSYWDDRPLQSIAEELGLSRFALARELHAFFDKMHAHLGEKLTDEAPAAARTWTADFPFNNLLPWVVWISRAARGGEIIISPPEVKPWRRQTTPQS